MYSDMNESLQSDTNYQLQKDAISFSPRKILVILVGIALSFIALSITGRILMWHVPQTYTKLWRLIPMFDVNLEYNFPSYYASLLLLTCAILLAYIGINAKIKFSSHYQYWLGLAAIFFFLALDEMLMIHEIFTDPLRSRLNTDGVLYYAWVIPYMVFVLAVGLIYFRFLWQIPKKTRKLFILSGVLYVGGALLLEMVVGYIVRADLGSQTQVYILATTEEHFEEFLEMLGASVFVYALLLYIRKKKGYIQIHLDQSQKLSKSKALEQDHASIRF
jgi:hypothetical protein